MLPEDLDRIGRTLEVAAVRAQRRRARRQSVMNGAGAIALAVPLAIAFSAAPLAPSAGLPLGPSTSTSTAGMSFMLALPFQMRTDYLHIPDERLPAVKVVCLDGHDCRVPYEPSLAPAPAGRV
jgi:hypothetical protein